MTKQAEMLNGAQAVIASLEAEGVDTVFGYPGGQAMRIYDALYGSIKITHLLSRHEQAAVHEADGYARSSGKTGVVLVTSGPGATNTVTGIATAYMDSVPLVVISAQVPKTVIGTDSFQESDIVGITLPVVKHSYLVQTAPDIPRIIHEAFHLAGTGRPGPVLIDIPSNLLSETFSYRHPTTINLPSYKPTFRGNDRQVERAVQVLARAERPVLYAGGGVIAADASDALRELAEMLRIPVATTLMGKGAFPSTHPLYLGPIGIHGATFANLALQESDLLVAVGVRFSDRVIGTPDSFAQKAKIIHIDIDPAEIGKIREAQVPIVGHAEKVLSALVAKLKKAEVRSRTEKWLEMIDGWRQSYPLALPVCDRGEDPIQPEILIKRFSDSIDPETSLVSTDVGQHQMWAAQFVDRTKPRTFLSSGGLGTMGFGLPAAIGAAKANPGKQVFCITGDGSLQMNLQELITAPANGLVVKVLLVNNNCLGMVRQLQRVFCDRRFFSTLFDANPDFGLIAQAYGWESLRITTTAEIDFALRAMMQSSGCFLLEACISPDEDVYPMVAAGCALDDQILSIDAAVGAVGKQVEGEEVDR